MLMLKGALAKILAKKILRLKLKEKFWFVIRSNTGTSYFKKQIPSECIFNRVSTYILLNKFFE